MTSTSTQDEIKARIEQLRDPARSSQAVLALLSQGKAAVPALVEFLRASKPSTVAEPRLLAVEGLGMLKGTHALEALIEVAAESLENIPDPVVRLSEEAVASRAALALEGFTDAKALHVLFELLYRKPLVGVAEAFGTLREPRALPRLVEWLEEDFVSEPACRAILAYGRACIPHLLASLREKHFRHGVETGMSRRRRARILDMLADLACMEEIAPVQDQLHDPVESVRLQAVRLFLRCGTLDQKRTAFREALKLLDSKDNRNDCEELLRRYVHLGFQHVKEEIKRRRGCGESEEACYPRETTLAVLVRIARSARGGKGRPA